MGASDFCLRQKGTTAREAFKAAVEEAQYEEGHGGYTGTIAEKTSYVMIKCPDGVKPEDYADQLIEECDDRIDDKWGPAGCINCDDGTYLFFGFASS